MLNPDAEINRLRSHLMMKQIDMADVDQVCDAASQDVNSAILTIVSEAMVEAAEYAAEIGADEFIDDVDVAEIGGSYNIITRSGQTNYSQPEIKNLPNLLKNAKTAEDGSRYKVIPLDDNNEKRVGNSIFEDQRALQSKIQAARDAVASNLRIGQSPRTNQMTERFREMVKQNLPARKSFYSLDRVKQNSTQKPRFATASSKQDPETSWVIPARDLDMTGYLMDINSRMQQDIFDTVNTIVREYERLF